MKKVTMRSRVPMAVATAVALVLSLVWADTASANTSNSITSYLNSSDPELIHCPNPGGGTTMCLFSSVDMGSASGLSIPYGQNYYPMEYTRMWRYIPGTDASNPANWVYQGDVIAESYLYPYGVPNHAYHLWAPGVRYWRGTYYVYVPDVVNVNDESHSSRVFLFTTNNLAGNSGYTYRGEVATNQSWLNGGYMSDPNMFVDSNGWSYLVYANGDNSNCGGLSMGRLRRSHVRWYANPQQITINNWGNDIQANSSCNGLGHPYLEGPALYRSSDIGAPSSNPTYTLIFAAKPKDGTVPASCAGSSSSDKEVIAYATSNTVTGPYNYQGIMMCGSTSEWTNQASVVKHTANNGKYLFAWHDGGDTYHNRRTHLMCLRWNSSGKAIQIGRSGYNLSNCP